ncbi:MAG: hypothetical protein CBC48_18760 [bacterium TMED88]|nr:amidohydrolase [Deltaproteobacteria bacterium]OUV23488.1 MAG: hypothetical protein CBC48_18760 [bacterium TMED88]
MTWNAVRLFCLFCLGVGWLACSGSPEGLSSMPRTNADVVFFGDRIMTVDPTTEGAQAVVVVGDEIAAVGNRPFGEAWIGPETRVVELGDQSLLPGFIDAHGHAALVMQFLPNVNVSSPPVGPAQNIDDIVDLLKAHIEEKQIPPGEWVIGYGYDDSLLAENRHPTREDLDRVSTEHKIALVHVSFHLGTFNSAALEASGINAETPNPPGGVIRRQTDSKDPNGVMEEAAAMMILRPAFEAGAAERFAPDLLAALNYHAANGITTVQDGASALQFTEGVRQLAAFQPLPIDLVAYPHSLEIVHLEDLAEMGFSPSYENGFRVGGVKFVLDGSPQGRTAWLTEPYTEGPPGASADYVAYPIVDPQHYLDFSKKLIQAEIPFLAHANGDAAIDLMIEGIDQATPDGERDHRSVAIHAQLTREDQLDEMKRLGIVPSYFAAHPYFWGDWHRVSFGDERASRISPLRSTRDRNIPFSIHNDAPVVPPDMLRLIQIAVERETRSGHVLGPDQRISVEDAVHAVTLGSAYQYFEEDRKGSITPGKRADLVVLSQDPRAVDPNTLDEIEVIETIARGRTVYPAAAP